MIDPELEAIQKCTELLKDLDDEGKIRVIQYLINRYKLTPNHQSSFQPNAYVPTNSSGQLPANSSVYPEVEKATVDSTLPALREIVKKDLPKSEPEWILIYCYYASGFGENEFTRENIVSFYEQSKRWSLQKNRNLTKNINAAVKKDWIKSINEQDFIMLEVGKQYANEILNGNSILKPRRSTDRKKNKNENGLSRDK
jgi:hypothetical protein